MSIESFLLSLKDLGVELWAEQGRLRVRGPQSALTPELAERIKAQKDELLAVLNSTRDQLLSGSQQSLWTLYRLHPDSVAYNVACAMETDSEVDAAALEQAFETLVDRHEVLRSRIVERDGSAGSRPLDAYDVDFAVEAGQGFTESDVDQWLHASIDQPFVLEKSAPVRLRVLRRNAGDIVLLVCHHIVADYWSLEILLRELATLYAAARSGTDAVLPRLSRTYADFAREQRAYLESPAALADWEFWKTCLDTPPPGIELMSGTARGPADPTVGLTIRKPFGAQRMAQLESWARDHETTPFAVMFGLYALLLSRCSGRDDVVIGMPTAGRNNPENEDLVGHFVNTLPVRARVDGAATMRAWIVEFSSTVRSALAHQDFPFTEMVRRIAPDRQAGRSPFFQHMFNWNQRRGAGLDTFGRVRLATSNGIGGASHELTLTVAQERDDWQTVWSFSTASVESWFVDELCSSLEYLVDQLIDNPDRKLRDAQLVQLVPDESGDVDESLETIDRMVSRQADRTPGAPAVASAQGGVTYRQLMSMAGRITAGLQQAGVVPGDRVAVMLDRHADLIATLLGIMQAGAAYVPLDPSYPEDRLDFILDDSCPRLLVVDRLDAWAQRHRAVAHESLKGEVAINAESRARADDLAYLIYTSGSTGRPKAVAIEHRQTCAMLDWATRLYSREDLSGVLASTSLCFDLSVFEIFAPLCTGGQVLLADNALALPELERRDQITLINTVPSAMDTLLHNAWIPSSVRVVNLAGEALLRPLADRVYALPHVERLYNLYGPSEDTTYSTWSLVDRDAEVAPLIGRAIDGSTARVLDRHLNDQPAGVPGELYMGGCGVSRGYLGRPRLTAERYIPDPYSSRPGARLYRTGDFARRNLHGDLVYLGRADQQIKRRGFRIELGEIEAQLLKVPGVEEAAVCLTDVETASPLVAFIVGSAKADACEKALRMALPAHMLPDAFTVLEKLPRNANGKIDRGALCELSMNRPVVDRKAGPRVISELGRLVEFVWSALLGAEPVEADTHFFQAGGHSLLAAQAVARINRALDLALTPDDLFSTPVFSAFVDLVASRTENSSEDSLPLTASGRTTGAVSPSQKRLWVMQDLDRSQKTAYSMGIVLRIEGDLDSLRMEWAVRQLAQHHPALRSVFRNTGAGLASDVVDVDAIVLDMHPETTDNWKMVAHEMLAEPFSVEEGPLFRCRLIRAEQPDQWVVLLCMHHMVADGGSLSVIAEDLARAYDGAALDAMEMTYVDFAAWQNKSLEANHLQAELDYWSCRLGDVQTQLALPCDQPRPRQRSSIGEQLQVQLPDSLATRLEALARAHDVTPHMLYFTAYSLLLSRWCTQDDLVIGVPVSQRRHAGLERVVGMFANTVPVRVQVNEAESCIEFLKRTRADLLASYSHSNLPFDVLVDRLDVARDAGSTPLVQATFALEHVDAFSYSGETTLWTGDEFPGCSAKFDLSMQVRECGGEYSANLVYAAQLFNASTIKRLMDGYIRLLESIAQTPNARLFRLTSLGNDERELLRDLRSGAAASATLPINIAQVVEQHAQSQPDAVAVSDHNESVSYAELNRRAGRVAAHLSRKGLESGDRVAVCMTMQVDAVVAMLATWKLGCAYLPVDPNYPAERIKYLCTDANARVIFCDSDGPLDHIPSISVKTALAEDREEHPVAAPHPESAAYVIYTSGSTGLPKGVVVSHRALNNLIDWHNRAFDVDATTRASQMAGFAFDAAAWELWPHLVAGASVHVVPRETRVDLPALFIWLTEKQIDLCFMPTPLAEAALGHDDVRTLPLRILLTGGDRLRSGNIDDLPFAVYNNYGPTEFAVVATSGKILAGTAPPPIGKPISGTTCYILDAYGTPSAIGARGELCLSGSSLGTGYIGNPRLTAERFLPDPHSHVHGSRMYCTGDIVKSTDEGTLHFIGRNDNQVKLRGYRIELAEIDALANGHADVAQAVTVLRQSENSNASLVCYYVANRSVDEQVVSDSLRATLSSSLPDYMVPAAFVRLDSLPVTANGKLDYAALPEPIVDTTAGHIAPRTAQEELIAGIWEALLNRSSISVDDDFFDLGGHSLLAMQVVGRIQECTGVACPLSSLFDNPTVEKLAQALASDSGTTEVTPLPSLNPDHGARYQPFPLTEVQQTYLIGRSGAYDLGDIATQVYSEIEVGMIDVERLSGAWRSVIERHDMLRMIITEDHQQQVLPVVPDYEVEFEDLDGFSDAAQQERIAEIRTQMSQTVRSGYQWPLFENRVTRLNNGRYRLHTVMDALVVDGWSNQIVSDELMAFYLGQGDQLPPVDVRFRDYILAEQRIRTTDLYSRSREYWVRRVDQLPGPPELPIVAGATTQARGRFRRREARFGADEWDSIRKQAQNIGVTPTVLLLSAYSAVLGAFSKQSDFVLNLTLFNRLPLHPRINSVVGDFTSLNLLEVRSRPSDGFAELAQQVQRQLWRDLEHRYFGGVEVLREMARRNGDGQRAIMPVVFTSALAQQSAAVDYSSELNDETRELLKAEDFGISQTSQVWLDHVVSEVNGGLNLTWDAVEDLFEPGVLDAMFDAYTGLLSRICADDDWRHARLRRLPEAQHERRSRINNTTAALPVTLLHRLVEEQGARTPEAAAIITSERTIDYRTLVAAGRRLAWQLRKNGARPNTLIAVVMDKGWEQVVASTAIMMSGAAYLPIDVALPTARISQILDQAEAEQVLIAAEAAMDDAPWRKGREITVVDEGLLSGADVPSLDSVQELEDLAYVIFTSGSTGTPKGVMINHRGACNTVLDVNERFAITSEDRVLALSSMSFDLSVWDVFGMLAAGGAIVIPQSRELRDPSAWLEYMTDHHVTVFNAVPALAQLLTDYCEAGGLRIPGSTRLVMMSGDWIPVVLPDRIRALARPNEIRTVSLGGATEASIWSIMYSIEDVDPTWRSIPYGRPMTNQTFHVLREDLTPCPDYVTGHLFIGGQGVAQGYWRDSQRTEASFLAHPETGERLYRTGDLGRYLGDGTIEFLGREDAQVKINGFRVELEEVEACLLQHPGVNQAAATVTRSESGVTLHAFVVPSRDPQPSADAAEIAEKVTLKLRKPAILNQFQKGQGLALDRPEVVYARDGSGAETECEGQDAELGKWLGCLAQFTVSHALLPKYYYPSAGSLNPVQTFVFVYRTLTNGVAEGVYYHQPDRHYLHRIAALPAGAEQADHDVSVVMVGELTAIEPVYGDVALDFCRLEAGYMSALLTDHGAALGWSVVDASSSPTDLDAALDLADSQRVLSCAHYRRSTPRGGFVNMPLLHRQSFRSFLGGATDKGAIERVLRAAGAGDLHGQVAVSVHGAVESLEKGLYRFDGQNLVSIGDGCIQPDSHGAANRRIAEQSAFVVLYLADDVDDDRIIEAGSWGQRMMSVAPFSGVGLCPLGHVPTEAVSAAGITGQYLHGFAGGAVSEDQLNGWAELEEDAGPGTPTSLRDFIADRLPAYMVPARIVELDSLPLSANGKVARDRLPDFDHAPSPTVDREAARGATETTVFNLWAEALGHDDFGVTDSFFELGGNSMMLIQVHRRLSEEFEQQIAIVDLFRATTVRSLAHLLSSDQGEAADTAVALKKGARQRQASQRARSRRARLAGNS